MRVVRDHFRPEFLNRLDEIVLFHRLQRADMAAIVRIQLARLRAVAGRPAHHAGAGRAGAELAGRGGLRPGVRGAAAEAGDPAQLQNPLAGQLLEGTIHDGETVHVSADRDGLVINGRLAEAA